jgi:hypothetical protein
MKTHIARVIACEATDCLYNKKKRCHTFGITIGQQEPCCDTFFESAVKGGPAHVQATIGACHVSHCVFNSNYECTAESVEIKATKGHPDCATFVEITL